VFIALRYDLEEQVGLLAADRQVADLIDDQQLVCVDRAMHGLPITALTLRRFQHQHEIGGTEKASLVALPRFFRTFLQRSAARALAEVNIELLRCACAARCSGADCDQHRSSLGSDITRDARDLAALATATARYKAKRKQRGDPEQADEIGDPQVAWPERPKRSVRTCSLRISAQGPT